MFFENHQQEFDATGCNFEREVNEIQIRIAKIEDQLDITMSNTKVNHLPIPDFHWSRLFSTIFRILLINWKSPTKKPSTLNFKLEH